MHRGEQQYLQLIKNIINNGLREKGRNGNTLSILGANMRFSLKNNKIPFTTTKRLAWKPCLKELLWFIKGDTNNENLQTQNVKIWNDNASREFLDSRGLYNLDENDLGPVYGHQWRFYNAKYSNCYEDYSNKELHNLNQQLIALEKSFISDQGMYFGSWYKSLYASSDPFSGYAAWILPGLEYEIALKSSDRLQEWDLRYTSAINSLTLKMKQLIQDLK